LPGVVAKETEKKKTKEEEKRANARAPKTFLFFFFVFFFFFFLRWLQSALWRAKSRLFVCWHNSHRDEMFGRPPQRKRARARERKQ